MSEQGVIIIVPQLLQHCRVFFVLFLVCLFFCFAPFSRLLRNAGSSETNTDPSQLESISLHAFSDTEIVIKCIWAIQTNFIHTRLWLKTKIIRFGWQIIIIKLSSQAFASWTFVTFLFLKDSQEGQQANILMYYDMCTRTCDWQQMNCNLLSGHMLRTIVVRYWIKLLKLRGTWHCNKSHPACA